MIRSLSRQALPIVAGVFVACALIQVFLAGRGVFDDPQAFITHREFGYLFGWLTLVVLVLAVAGRQARRVTALSALLLVLFAFQSIFVALRTSQPQLAALHPVNGFFIILVAIVIARMTWTVRRETAIVGATQHDRKAASGVVDASPAGR